MNLEELAAILEGGPVEPDVEGALVVLLDDLAYTDTFHPHDYKTQLELNEGRGAFLHIRRTGGGASRRTDESQISIRGFTLASAARPRSSHKLLAVVTRRIEALNTVAPVEIPDEVGGGKVLLESGEKISGPVQLPWLDDNVLLVECIYRVAARR